jgi:NAD(P)-dependent dehydrogenase (short-subunit alcohol dehydrogenase family)
MGFVQKDFIDNLDRMKVVNSKKEYVLITGGTSGLGLELVRLFLRDGYFVIATGRQIIEIPGFDDRFKLVRADLSNMDQISSLIKELLKSYSISIIINNAGSLSHPEYKSTINGFEYSFQVNYLSHLLINEIILRNIKENDVIKIAAVTSPVYRLANSILTVPQIKDNYSALQAYSSSKLYLAVMCEFLPSRFPGLNLHCFSFDPGTFSSGISRTQKGWFRGLYQIASPFMRKPGKVAEVLYRLLNETETQNGMIYDFKNNANAVPVRDKAAMKAFMISCYSLIQPYIDQNFK